LKTRNGISLVWVRKSHCVTAGYRIPPKSSLDTESVRNEGNGTPTKQNPFCWDFAFICGEEKAEWSKKGPKPNSRRGSLRGTSSVEKFRAEELVKSPAVQRHRVPCAPGHCSRQSQRTFSPKAHRQKEVTGSCALIPGQGLRTCSIGRESIEPTAKKEAIPSRGPRKRPHVKQPGKSGPAVAYTLRRCAGEKGGAVVVILHWG